MSEQKETNLAEKPSKTPETDTAPEHYGIPFNELNDDVWRTVLALYFSDATSKPLDPDDDLYYMFPVEEVTPGTQLRLGSRFSMHSKLQVVANGYNPDNIPLISFNFYVNDDLDAKTAQQAKEVQDLFKTDVDEYLQSTGHAVPIIE